MRRWFKIFIACLLLVFTLQGCSRQSDSLDEVCRKFTEQICSVDALYNFGTGECQNLYDSCDSDLKDTLKCLLSEISFSPSLQADDGSIVIRVAYPDIEAVTAALSSNKALQSELKNLKKTKATGAAQEKCVLAYVRNILISGEARAVTKDITVNISSGALKEDLSQISDALDTAVAKICRSFLTHDFYSGIALSKSSNDDGTADIQWQKALNDFTFCFNGVNYLLCNLTVVNGRKAAEELASLDLSNSAVKAGDENDIFLISYDVVNLSMHTKSVFHNLFRLADSSGRLLETIGFHISGTKERSVLKPGCKAHFSIGLVGPKDADLYWYDRKLGAVTAWKNIASFTE